MQGLNMPVISFMEENCNATSSFVFCLNTFRFEFKIRNIGEACTKLACGERGMKLFMPLMALFQEYDHHI